MFVFIEYFKLIWDFFEKKKGKCEWFSSKQWLGP